MTLSQNQRSLLRLVADCPLIRYLSPSEDPDMLELVDASLVEGSVGWVDGERMWTYRTTRYGSDVAESLSVLGLCPGVSNSQGGFHGR